MLDSIYLGMTGLEGFSKGLRVIANNTANLNTPGYKSSTLQFTDLLLAGSAGGARTPLGAGLGTAGTRLDLRQGALRQTGNNFDLALDGEGMFTLRDAQGRATYSRAGQFEFNDQGVFVDRQDGSVVMGRDAQGREVEISLAGLRISKGKATGTARFSGNLSSTVTQQQVDSITVMDALGQAHSLTARFTNTGAAEPGSWQIELFDDASSVGASKIVFVDGKPTPATATASFTYTPSGGATQPLTLDFGGDVTSFASGNLSTLAMSTQDGYAPGGISGLSFDASGALQVAYANGQTVQGPSLLLGRFASPEVVQALGGGRYAPVDGAQWERGVAGQGGFGRVSAGALESSNVDLSREFSELVIMQRGYQASSQVIASANDMLQELFRMKSK